MHISRLSSPLLLSLKANRFPNRHLWLNLTKHNIPPFLNMHPYRSLAITFQRNQSTLLIPSKPQSWRLSIRILIFPRRRLSRGLRQRQFTLHCQNREVRRRRRRPMEDAPSLHGRAFRA